MKRLLIIAGVIIAVFLLIQWSRADYLEFAARRDDWHKRCDAYVGEQPALTDASRLADCRREAAELVAYAKQKGWSQ